MSPKVRPGESRFPNRESGPGGKFGGSLNFLIELKVKFRLNQTRNIMSWLIGMTLGSLWKGERGKLLGEIFGGKRRVYQSKLRLPHLVHCVKVVPRALSLSLENELLFPLKIEIEPGGKRDCLPIKLIEIQSESSFSEFVRRIVGQTLSRSAAILTRD